jgi:hypothetical protein
MENPAGRDKSGRGALGSGLRAGRATTMWRTSDLGMGVSTSWSVDDDRVERLP